MSMDFKPNPPPSPCPSQDRHKALHSTHTHLILQFKALFPYHLQFYHLGEIQLCQPVSRDRSTDQKVAYFLKGDIQGTFVISVPADQELSPYLEMGNVLLGKLSTELSRVLGIDMIFSPPQVLSPEKMTSTENNKWNLHEIFLSYRFSHLNEAEVFDSYLDISRIEEIGNA